MTTQSFKKKMGLLLLLAGFLTMQAFTITNDDKKNPGKKTAISAKVNFMGIKEDQLLFSVSFEKENPENKKQTEIKVIANGEYEIFSDLYRNSQAQMLFKINTSNIEKVAFEISNTGEKINYSFDVKASYKEEITVLLVK